MNANAKAVILIVDDQPANVFALEHLLNAKDRVLLHAGSGKEGLKMALEQAVDLVILDVQMPGMDGFEVAQVLKSNRRTRDIPIIFATAVSKEHRFVMKGYEEGAVDYLYKPLDPEIVKAKVAVLLKIQMQKKQLVAKNLALQKDELLINNSSDIIGIIDRSTFKIEEVNNAFTTILGYTREEARETALTFYLANEGRTLVQRLSTEDREKLFFETRIYCSDRSIKWLQWNVIVRYGKWFVNARDVTQIKEVEKIRDYLATVVRQSSDAVYLHDREGRIISWNHGAEKMYGYSESEALQMKVWNIIPDYLRPGSSEMISSVIAGKRVEDVQTRRLDRHGKMLDVLFSAAVVMSDPDGFESIAITERDITQQKHAEEQLRESEKRFRGLFDQAPFPMWVYDLDTLEFLQVNETAVKTYGYSKEQFLSMRISDIRPREDLPKLLESVKERRQRPVGTAVWQHRLRDGKLVQVEITSHLMNYEGRQAELVVAKDITERLRAEEEIRKLNAELRNSIVQLETTNKELESFSYSVSHDLRAPLRALNGYSEMIREDYDSVLDDEGKRLLGNIQHNARKMGMLIDDLLAFSRLGRKEVQKTRVNMRGIVDAVLTEVAAPERAKIHIGSLPDACADHSLVHQVWVNLISNALKYAAKKPHPEIEIGSDGAAGETVYYVRDNGAGFDMKYAGKLFGVFQRLHNPNEFEGTGIGLAIVQRIVIKHGGRVWAEGKVDEGATFYFSLPDTKTNEPS